MSVAKILESGESFSAISKKFWKCVELRRHAASYHTPYVQCREQGAKRQSHRRDPWQSKREKRAKKGGASIDPRAYDAAKKIKGKKRHLLVDTVGSTPSFIRPISRIVMGEFLSACLAGIRS